MSALLAAALGSAVVTLSPAVAITLTGTLIPLLVGLATKSKASSTVKEAVNGLAAVAVALIAAASTTGGIQVSKLVVLALTTFGATKAAYLLWRALGVTDLVQQVAPGVGIGTPVIDTTATVATGPPALGGDAAVQAAGPSSDELARAIRHSSVTAPHPKDTPGA